MSWYETPTGMAKRLATYINEPSTIRVRVLEYFGHAPSVEKCRQYRAAFLDEKLKLKQAAEAPRKLTPFKCGHPTTHDNVIPDYRGYAKCKTCKRERDALAAKRYRERQRKEAGALAMFPAHYRPKVKSRPSLTKIVEETVRLTGVEIDALKSDDKHKDLCVPRFAVALVAADYGHASLHIAKALGRTDHSTGTNAKKRGQVMFDRDAEFRTLVTRLRAAVAEPEKVAA